MPEIAEAWSNEEGARRAVDLLNKTFPDADSHQVAVFRAPGRVNLIGEHLDYNGGSVLPMALPHSTFLALRRRRDNVIQITTDGAEPATWEGTISQVQPGADVPTWVKYALGVAWAMQPPVTDVGFDAALVSCVPLGAGLSSSAAIECVAAIALTDLTGRDLDRSTLAAACVRAENEVVGAPTGGMDQAASLLSAKGHALSLQCDTGATEQVPFDLAAAELELLVINTRAPHALVDGQYAQRRAACEAVATREGLEWLARATDTEAILARCADDIERRRARHVFTEQARVEEFVALLRRGNYTELGPLMTASHASLRDDYQVSCPELDVAVAASIAAGALGARMTGGGFGGSAIALVKSADRVRVEHAVEDAYAERGWPAPQFLECTPGAAAERC